MTSQTQLKWPLDRTGCLRFVGPADWVGRAGQGGDTELENTQIGSNQKAITELGKYVGKYCEQPACEPRKLRSLLREGPTYFGKVGM